MKRTIFLALLILLTAYSSYAKEYKVASPDAKITMTVNVGTDIRLAASFDGKELISNSKIAMILANGKILGENEKVTKVAFTKINDILKPVVANKKSEIADNCNLLIITLKSGFSVQF